MELDPIVTILVVLCCTSHLVTANEVSIDHISKRSAL